MRMKKAKQRITSMLLSVIMILGMTPVAAVAEAAALPIGTSGEITAFEALAADSAAQGVPLGTFQADLGLPDTLTVTIQLAASTDESVLDSGDADGGTVASPSDADGPGQFSVPLPVTWVSSPEYDGEAAGTYLFTPAVPEGITLASGVELPVITVTVSASKTTGTVTALDALPDDLRWQNTTEPEFPETVDGTVEGQTAEIPVTWEADHDYDAEAPQRGLYVFTAVLGEGYAPADGVELPRMTVYIPQTAGMMGRMAGAGTTASPLEITTAAQLAEIAVLVNARLNGLELFLFNDASAKATLELKNNLDLSAYASGGGWVPIGTSSNYFKGTFDGGGHRISNLTINRATADYQGLFGHISSGGVLKNLGIENANVLGKRYTGGVVGNIYGGTVQNCYTIGSIRGSATTSYDVGGVVGRLNISGMENCYSIGSVSGANNIGGVAGAVVGGSTLQNCYSTASVNSSAYGGGGVVGYLVNSTASNCYSTGAVSGNNDIGGVVGSDIGGVVGSVTASGTLQNCAALNPSASGSNDVGRVAGRFDASSTLSHNIAFNGTKAMVGVSAKSVIDDAAGLDGASKTAAEIKATGFFEALFGNDAAWTYAAGKLPGFGAAVDLPSHIVDGSDTNFRGAGTSENPYQISTPAELAKLAVLTNAGDTTYNAAHYELQNDLDLSGYASADSGEGWTPIGTNANQFMGSFDGSGNQITGLYIYRLTTSYQGLFGSVGNGGVVENLGVVNANVRGFYQVGGVAGAINGCMVQNCYATGPVNGISSVGGVVGEMSGGTVQNCYATGAVNGNSTIGGVAGAIDGGMVQNCYATGAVSGVGSIGGVAGTLISGTVQNCYATGTVGGGSIVGGVVGSHSSGTVQGCAALNPSITYLLFGIGRVIGGSSGGTHSGNIAFAGMTVNSSPIGGGTGADINGAPKTAAEIGATGFWTIATGFTANWDTDIWTIEPGRLPVLKGLAGQDNTIPHHISGAYFPGSGMSEDDPYKISTPAQLAKLAELVNAAGTNAAYGGTGIYYRLMNDIDLLGYASADGGKGWTPIGQFRGSFDGNHKVITGLYIKRGASNQGLFGYLSFGGRIENLGVVNVNITGGSYVGGVAGEVEGGTVQNCYSTGGVSGTGDYVGGVAGYIRGSGTVQNCYSIGGVSGTGDYIGGVAGGVNGGTVRNCYATGSVSGNACVGGVAGRVNIGTVQNCYATGSVSGTSVYIGGVAGQVEGGTVQNCYSTGSVSTTYTCSGGVVGIVSGGMVQNCAALNPSVSGAGNVGRVGGYISSGTLTNNYAYTGMICASADPTNNDGTDLTIATLFGGSFWTTAANWYGAPWDSTVWTFAEGKLPILTGLAGQSGEGGLYLTARDIQSATVGAVSPLTYNGSEQVPALTVTFGGQTLVKDTDYTASITSVDGAGTSAGTNAGTVTLTLTGIGSFFGTKMLTYTIAKKPVTITPDSGKGKVYGAADPALTFINSESLDASAFTGSLSRISGENAGSYAISLGDLSAGSNYALSLAPGTVNFTIEKREITLAADDKTVVKGSSLPALTYTVSNLAPSETVTDALSSEPTLACPTFDGNTPGSYAITLTGGMANGNYTIASRANGTLTVSNPPPSGGGFYMPPTSPISIAPETRPGQPVTAVISIAATVGTNGAASASIPDQLIADAISKAQDAAKAQGKSKNGVAVVLNIPLPQGASSLSTALSQNALQSLVNAGVTSFTINCAPLPSVSFDLKALKEIRTQSRDNISISIAPIAKLSSGAKKLIGTRPVYGVTVSYVKRGKVRNVTSLGRGAVTVTIPYVLSSGETTEGLYGVALDSKGRAARIKGAVYDPVSRCLLFPAGKLRTAYGVAYTAPRARR